MPTFIYKARDTTGRAVKGKMEAPDKAQLIDKLHKMGYMPTKVFEIRPGMELGSILDRFKRAKSDDMLMFYIQFSNMINSGLTILMSLSTLSKQIDNKALRDSVGEVGRQIEGGSTLSEALAAHPNIFSRLFINMVKAGEASGTLDAVLMRYAMFFEHQEDIKEKVKSALFYPVILLTFGIIVVLFIVTFVIPQFAQIYMKAGVRLPIPTLVVYKFGLFIKHYWYAGFAIAIAAILLMKLYSRTSRGAILIDTMKLRLPIVGPLYKKVAISRFARTLGTLLGAGVPILQSLDITREVVENKILEQVVSDARHYVEKGEHLAEPLKVSNEFPTDVVQMISVGEESGNLDGMLNKIADFYDMTVNYAIKKLTTVIEPIFLLILGCMVGVIMASMLMPIFDMVKTLRH
ncbi:MAG: type II secretion system F family protein [Candidatus Omnitrophota bacterium]|nr:type II secretion system F family protein [Candidatus Omnitrophota bacterium]